MSVLDQFWSRLAAARQAALLLDYDGTLAPFRVERDQAVPYPGVRQRLTAIRGETQTRLVIISGRAIDDLLPLLALEPPPEIWGCHGWEQLDAAGRRPAVALPQTAAAGLAQARQWLADEGLAPLSEAKPVSLAVHWRGRSAEQVDALRSRVRVGWQPIAAGHGLELHPFDGGLELRCPGRSKGTAIVSILDQLDSGDPVAFLGDDLTDEDGFKALKGKGTGILVNSRKRPTCADLQIVPPQGLLDFLDSWHRNAPGKQSAGPGGLS